MICSSCGNEGATTDLFLGILPCQKCIERQRRNASPDPVEFTSDEIKNDRIKYADDILQPFRQGELSKEYVDKHGANNLDVTEAEIKKAKKVWN